MRHGLLTACMPTASTSNIAGQNESFEPFTSNLYTRKTQAGEYTRANQHLIAELEQAGLWDEEMRRALVAANGSVQRIARVPADIRRRYRTARELHPAQLCWMAAAMAPFVCQSMSLNLYMDAPDLPKIIRFLLEGWLLGLKTGMYYVHTGAAADTRQEGSTSLLGAQSAGQGAEPESAEPLACARKGDDCRSCQV